VIVDLTTTLKAEETTQRRTLSGLLRALENPTSDMSATLLWNVLRENKAHQRTDWLKIADAVERGDREVCVIRRLEELARYLDVERAEVNARIHGQHAR
jgi:hypothetical protein